MPHDDMIFAPRFDIGSTYFADYFGLWMIHDEWFSRFISGVQGIDLRSHMRQRSGDDSGRSAIYETTKDGVALIGIHGPMMKFVPSMAEGTSTVVTRRIINLAARDPEVKGALIVSDTPGGTSKGNEDLASDVAKLASIKPVFAFIEDMTASAGVSIVSQATKRFANNETAMYGSIGTYAVLQDLSGMADKLGVKVHVVRAGEFKGAGTPGTEITEEQLAEVQRIVNQVNDSYLQMIAKGVGQSVESIRALADGRIILASDAVKAGLINGVQSYEATYQELVQTISRKSTPNKGGPKMSAEPATLAQLKQMFPKSSADWREKQLESNATASDAAIAYANHVEEQAAAERENHKKELELAKNAKPAATPSLGHAPLTTANVAGDDPEHMQTGDALADFDSAVRARLPRHREATFEERNNAIAYVARTQPQLHRDYVCSTNAKTSRMQRLLQEKFETVPNN